MHLFDIVLRKIRVAEAEVNELVLFIVSSIWKRGAKLGAENKEMFDSPFEPLPLCIALLTPLCLCFERRLEGGVWVLDLFAGQSVRWRLRRWFPIRELGCPWLVDLRPAVLFPRRLFFFFLRGREVIDTEV